MMFKYFADSQSYLQEMKVIKAFSHLLSEDCLSEDCCPSHEGSALRRYLD